MTEEHRSPDKAQRMRAERRKKKRMRVIRNRIIFGSVCLLILVLIIFGVTKLVKNVGNKAEAAEATTLTVMADKSVVLEEVEDFDEVKYSEEDFEAFVKENIESFNDTAGEDAIKLDKLKIKDESVYIKTTFATLDGYSAFTSYPTYMMTVEAAEADGIDVTEKFAKVENGKKGEVVNFSEEFYSYKCVIVNENINVKVPGIIVYVTDKNTEVLGEDTVSIRQPDGNNDVTNQVIIVYAD